MNAGQPGRNSAPLHRGLGGEGGHGRLFAGLPPALSSLPEPPASERRDMCPSIISPSLATVSKGQGAARSKPFRPVFRRAGKLLNFLPHTRTDQTGRSSAEGDQQAFCGRPGFIRGEPLLQPQALPPSLPPGKKPGPGRWPGDPRAYFHVTWRCFLEEGLVDRVFLDIKAALEEPDYGVSPGKRPQRLQ